MNGWMDGWMDGWMGRQARGIAFGFDSPFSFMSRVIHCRIISDCHYCCCCCCCPCVGLGRIGGSDPGLIIHLISLISSKRLRQVTTGSSRFNINYVKPYVTRHLLVIDIIYYYLNYRYNMIYCHSRQIASVIINT